MRSFRARLGDRAPNLPLVLIERGSLAVRDLALADGSDTAHCGSTPTARRVALSLRAPESLIVALAQLDGRAEAILLFSLALSPKLVTTLLQASACSCLVSDRTDLQGAGSTRSRVAASVAIQARIVRPAAHDDIGYDGDPKLVSHCLSSLVRTITPMRNLTIRPVWGLTYEATRFAGMQVLLQTCLGEGTLAAPDLGADIDTLLNFSIRNGCSHLSPTPTQWDDSLCIPK